MRQLRCSLPATASALVLALALTACGGGDGDEGSKAGSSNGSKKQFCAAFDKAIAAAGSPESASEAGWKKIQAAFEKVGDTAVPKAVTSEQRKGLGVIVDAITSIDFAEAQKAQTAGSIPGVSKEDQALAQGFISGYYQPECLGQEPGAPAPSSSTQ